MPTVQDKFKKASAALEGKNLIILILLILCLGLGGYIVWFEGAQNQAGVGGGSAVSLSKDEAGKLAMKFINEVALKGTGAASLVDISEASDVFNIKVALNGQEILTYLTRDGKLIFFQGVNIEEETEKAQNQAVSAGLTIGEFETAEGEVCEEDGKPVMYFFGSSGCPHCVWEKPIIEKVAKSFGDLVSFHENIDTDRDMDIFNKFNPDGGVPTLVLGCKYYRVGSGENAGEDTETKNLTALLCKLTGSQSSEVCDGVKDLIEQIK